MGERCGVNLQAKQVHSRGGGEVIRLAPPLVLTEEQLYECVAIIRHTLLSFE